MLNYHNDKDFKLEYDPVNNKFAFQKNIIGAHDSTDIEEADFSYTDLNSIFVSDTVGNDSTGDGTEALPYKTILFSINACTVTKVYVIVLDSVLYSEELDSFDNDYFSGLYAATGETPTLSRRVLDYTESDSNTIFVSKAGDDADPGTRAEPKLTLAGAVAACDATHQNIMIDDSGTYIETGWEFTGNVKNLRAKLGEKPTVQIEKNQDYFSISQQIGPTSYDSDSKFNDCCILSDGKKIITYTGSGGSDPGYFLVLNSDNTTYKSKAAFTGQTSTYEISCCVYGNNNIFLAYSTTVDGFYQVINKDGDVIKEETSLPDVTDTAGIRCCTLNSGSIFICFEDDADGFGKYLVLDPSDWSTEVNLTTFKAGAVYDVGCDIDNNGIVWITYATAGPVYYIGLDSSDWSVHKTETTISSGVNYEKCDCVVIDNNYLFFIYSSVVATALCNYKIINTDDYTEVKEQTLISAAYYGVGVAIDINGDVFMAIADRTSYTPGYYLTYRPAQYLLDVSTDCILNGIVFKPEDKQSLTKYINSAGASLDISCCDFTELESSTTNQSCLPISSNDELNIDHCQFYDCDNGPYTQSNSSVIENNLFYRINEGYALHIDGAGSGITIEHNTFFDNYSGLYLENNDGDEVVKNNIFYDCDNYDINADTDVTISNTTYTGTMLNITIGASVVKANPLFINEGALDPDDTNLQLKLRILGYPTDSPAYLLGDETSPDRDAGAWNITAIGSITTWSSLTCEKPATGIDVSNRFIGDILTQNKDGSIDSDFDDVMEVVEFKFAGLKNADWTNLMAMLICKNNEVRLYPDPDTYPDAYNLYKIIYSDVKSSPKMFRLSRTGVQDFQFTLARAYE
jgi:parallel beta-helix repeat protein